MRKRYCNRSNSNNPRKLPHDCSFPHKNTYKIHFASRMALTLKEQCCEHFQNPWLNPKHIVQTTIESAPSYRCKVNSENRHGLLQIGFKRYKVAVIEMSRDSFTVRLSSSIGRRIAIGRKCKLLYEEMLWSVGCTSKWIGEANLIDVEFQQLDELTPPKIRKAGLSGTANNVSATGQKDPTLPLALLVGFILTVLIAPAWGGKWGTSDQICSAVSTTWTAIVQLVSGSR